MSGLNLTQQSISIILKNKSLLVFSVTASILVVTSFVVGLTPLFAIEAEAFEHNGYVSTETFITFMAILLALFFFVGIITLLFNAALTYCALRIIQQKPYSIQGGFKIMLPFFVRIVLIKVFYDVIAIFIKFMRYWVDGWRKSPLSKKLVSGLPWNDAVLLITPVLITEDTRFLSTLQRSAKLICSKWNGPDITFRYDTQQRAMSIIGFLALTPVIIGLIIGGTIPIVTGTIITATVTIVKNIIQSTTLVIISCALYLHAINVDTTEFFNQDSLKNTFRVLTKKELH